MIIKNNFNKKNTNGLDDYQSISKTRNNNFDDKNVFIKENLNNKIIRDIIDSDTEYEDDSKDEDKWDFFR